MSSLGLFSALNKKKNATEVQKPVREEKDKESDYENGVQSTPKKATKQQIIETKEKKPVETKETQKPSPAKKTEQVNQKKSEEDSKTQKNGNSKKHEEEKQEEEEEDAQLVEDDDEEANENHQENEENAGEGEEESQPNDDKQSVSVEDDEEQGNDQEEENEGEQEEQKMDPMDRMDENGSDKSGSINDAKKEVNQVTKPNVVMLPTEESDVKELHIKDSDEPNSLVLMTIKYVIVERRCYYDVGDVYKDSGIRGWASTYTAKLTASRLDKTVMRVQGGIVPCAQASVIFDMLSKSLKFDEHRKTRIMETLVKRHPQYASYLEQFKAKLKNQNKKRKAIYLGSNELLPNSSTGNEPSEHSSSKKKKKAEKTETQTEEQSKTRHLSSLTETDKLLLQSTNTTLKNLQEELKTMFVRMNAIGLEIVSTMRVIRSFGSSN